MQRPCAYCKEFGHHIRACELLEAKNRRQQVQVPIAKPQVPIAKPQVPPSIIKVSIVTKPAAKNTFAELYSSDDEVEEGEIVEERRPNKIAVVSDSETSCEPPPPSPPPQWTRSGIKGIQIPRCQPIVESDSEDEGPGCDYGALAYSLSEMAKYMEKFRGRSWADIEYDSDLE